MATFLSIGSLWTFRSVHSLSSNNQCKIICARIRRPSRRKPRRRRTISRNSQPQTPILFPPAPVVPDKGNWKVLERGVTAPQGFQAAGIYAGLRKSETKPDLSLVYCDSPATAAGVFTKNRVCAAPVIYDKKVLQKRSHVRAVLINAGQANAATGPEGEADAEESATSIAEELGIEKDEVLVMSTGVIGHRIKMDSLIYHLPDLTDALARGPQADMTIATAITTTDLAYKSGALQMEIEGEIVTIGGMCKGSGMINPDMATLLGVLTCDAPVKPSVWKEMLVEAMDLSFNRITVDGDTSTNDTVLALTSGKAKIKEISDMTSPSAVQLRDALTALSQALAKSVAWDGEGATCLIEVHVTGSKTDKDAHTVAKSIANSLLTKAAIFGHDPNWGRIAAAAGYAGVAFSVEDLAITLGDIPLMKNGVPLDFDRLDASDYLKERCEERGTVNIKVSIGNGPGYGMAWGCDLSYDYVGINAEYTT